MPSLYSISWSYLKNIYSRIKLLIIYQPFTRIFYCYKFSNCRRFAISFFFYKNIGAFWSSYRCYFICRKISLHFFFFFFFLFRLCFLAFFFLARFIFCHFCFIILSCYAVNSEYLKNFNICFDLITFFCKRNLLLHSFFK